jgi:hypothetical protein
MPVHAFKNPHRENTREKRGFGKAFDAPNDGA